MVSVRADYRVKDRHGTMPDKCVEDAKSAIRWLRANATKFGIEQVHHPETADYIEKLIEEKYKQYRETVKKLGFD